MTSARLLTSCVGLLVFALIAIAGCVLLIRAARRMVLGDYAKRLTRMQHGAFERRLRELIFKDPERYLQMLASPEADWFLHKLWDEAGDACARIGFSAGGGGSAAPAELREGAEPHPVRLPADGLAVHRFELTDGSALTVVTLPTPQLSGETYLIGIRLPADASFEADLTWARERVRYFVLNKWSSGRDTDLCEWRPRGRQLTYNIGAPRDPQGFARALVAKLNERRAMPKAVRQP